MDERFSGSRLYLVKAGYDGLTCELIRGDELSEFVHGQFCCCGEAASCAQDGYFKDFLDADEWDAHGWSVNLEDGYFSATWLTQEPKQLSRLRELEALLNTPEIEDFDKAVPLEAAHQVARWGAAQDAGKTPADWFWLVGYLAGKALAASVAGDVDKAKHHCISTSAVLRNWHAHIRSGESAMRPALSEEKTASLEVAP